MGALGSTAVHYLRNAAVELRLIDFDRVESNLPMIGLVGATLARAVQDFVATATRHDYLVSLWGIVRTT